MFYSRVQVTSCIRTTHWCKIVRECQPMIMKDKYSRTSMARTPMARLLWLIRTFLSPYEILPIAQENKYLRKFSYFIVKLYDVCTH